MPRLASRPTTVEPAESLASLFDEASAPARSEAARSTALDVVPPKGTTSAESSAELARGQPDNSKSDSAQAQKPSNSDAAFEAPPNAGSTDDAALKKLVAGDDASQRQLPDVYRMRVAPNRLSLAERQGATATTEAAVKAALVWLAENQEPDGRWDGRKHGAGRELIVAGQNRQGAGIDANTGMTGLALLAFLASGHTHRDGSYQEQVRRGLEYLLRQQAPNGNLKGKATAFAAMYCHAMATFALSEAYAMTGDERLREPVRRAINYTLAAQDPSGGGFRYRPGDPGDTSQCGWQLMALKSADLAGIPMPQQTRNGLIRFLRSVSAGQHGGLACYRPGERITRPMTAEALVCWQFLGMPGDHPANKEAGDYLLGGLPGEGEINLYYWYYATLAMYQLQGAHWEQWNSALRATLVARQKTAGPMAGSWDPQTVWGGYGGRVYSTAMATLCLEVYYRFLPLYLCAEPARNPTR
jgi:hypothetical protein